MKIFHKIALLGKWFYEMAPFNALSDVLRPYLLLVGGRTSFKNFALFLRAFESLFQHHGVFNILQKSPREQLEAELQSLVGGARVYMCDLSDRDFSVAYIGIGVLVYPSLYEVFSMPMHDDCLHQQLHHRSRLRCRDAGSS